MLSWVLNQPAIASAILGASKVHHVTDAVAISDWHWLEALPREVDLIAAADTVMDRPSRELLAEVFPAVPVHGELGEFESLLESAKAGKMLVVKSAKVEQVSARRVSNQRQS